MTTPSSKPDPDQFARVVLWHLAGLRADVLSLETRLAELRGQAPIPSEEVRTELKAQARDKLYLEALDLVGLQSSGLPPEPPKDP